MNIAEYSIKNKVISWLFIVILAIGGVTSFLELGRLEDPAFTIKDAMIVATYPGATSKEVEEELTYPLEKEIRKLPYIDRITSTSSNGMSQIMVSMKMDYGPDELPQIWDEMRRKINDLQPTLPQGVQSLQIIDDFGDVYGVMLMLTGDDYDYVELKRYADHLRREIELVDGVGKVDIAGDQQEMLFVEISLDRLAYISAYDLRWMICVDADRQFLCTGLIGFFAWGTGTGTNRDDRRGTLCFDNCVCLASINAAHRPD